jgi:hypothetical protein
MAVEVNLKLHSPMIPLLTYHVGQRISVLNLGMLDNLAPLKSSPSTGFRDISS